MKIVYKINDKVSVEVESDTHTEIFEELAKLQETFSDATCGCCNSADIKFVVREDEETNKYYELKCNNIKCRAVLAFGQNKKPKGMLYPKRRWNTLSPSEKERRGPEPESGYLANGGWAKWVPKPKPQ